MNYYIHEPWTKFNYITKYTEVQYLTFNWCALTYYINLNLIKT